MTKRCLGINQHGKRCRAPIRREGEYFCCKGHEPFNVEFIQEGCFLCSEKDINEKEMKVFRCGHIVHMPCYRDWLQFSTYERDVCIICRENIKRDMLVITGRPKNSKGVFLHEDTMYILEEKRKIYEYIRDIEPMKEVVHYNSKKPKNLEGWITK